MRTPLQRKRLSRVVFSALVAVAAVCGGAPRPATAAPVIEGEVFRVYYRAELRTVAAVAHLPDEHRVTATLDVPDVETHAVESIRLMAWGRMTPFISFELAYAHEGDLSPPLAAPLPTIATPPPLPARFLDLEWALHDSESFVWLHSFDRLNVGIHLPVAHGLHFTFGRQAVRWGYGRLWFPADRFAPPRPVDPYREYAPGLDALQVDLALGHLTSVRIAFVPGEKAEEIVALARFEGNAGPVDYAVTAGDDHHRGVAGVGVRADFGLASVEGEALWFFDPDAEDHAEAVLGATFQLPFSLVATLEFAHDGAGARSPADYTALWSSPDWAGAGRVGVGRWYVGLAFDACPLPDLSLGVKAIVNIEDGSALLDFHLAASVADEAWIGVSAITGLGESRRADGTVGSEFGIAPHTYLVDLRLYF